MDPRITPLFVIDVQNGFVNDKSRHVVPAIVDLVARWDTAGGPVLFSRYLNYQGSPFVRLLGWTGLLDAPETDLVEDLAEPAATAALVTSKTTYSAYTHDVKALFKARGWTTAVLCGIATDSCVLATAVDLFEDGITPLVVTDACASEAGDDVHQAGLIVARRMIGRRQLVTTAELAQQWAPGVERSCA